MLVRRAARLGCSSAATARCSAARSCCVMPGNSTTGCASCGISERTPFCLSSSQRHERGRVPLSLAATYQPSVQYDGNRVTFATREPARLEVCLLLTATQEDFMRIRLLVAAAALVAVATPSLAAEFYIVQDTSTKRCSIVEQRPTTKTMTVVGPGTAYTTRTEAEGAMKTVKVCESGGTVGGPVPPPPPRRQL